MEQLRYIAIEGAIGAGKTSLAKLLTDKLHAKLVLENASENPFLEKFYKNPEQFAFQTQVFFLLSRYQQQMELQQQDLFERITISDYLFERDEIFAHLNLDEDEMSMYRHLHSLLKKKVILPDLVVFLQVSTENLIERIKTRGIVFEQNISQGYLEAVNQAFNNFFFHYSETPLLVINTNEIDFVNSHEDLDNLVKEIKEMGKGKKYYVPVSKRR
ncbi:MAG: deoxynucleoside kinase [bacterium]|nr:deoxynucleoside kinase [bacterium]